MYFKSFHSEIAYSNCSVIQFLHHPSYSNTECDTALLYGSCNTTAEHCIIRQ